MNLLGPPCNSFFKIIYVFILSKLVSYEFKQQVSSKPFMAICRIHKAVPKLWEKDGWIDDGWIIIVVLPQQSNLGFCVIS